MAEVVLELANMRPLRSVTAYLAPMGAFSITTAWLVDQTLTLLLYFIAERIASVESLDVVSLDVVSLLAPGVAITL